MTIPARGDVSKRRLASARAGWYSLGGHVARPSLVPVMPSRPLVALIVVFWLAANGALFYREVWPHWRPGEPPPFTVDLTEEVAFNKLGTSGTTWYVMQKGKRIGFAVSNVVRLPDRTYELQSVYRFERLGLFNLIELRKLTSAYHVTEEGELLGLSAEMFLQQPVGRQGGFLEHEFGVTGTVDPEERVLVPKFFYNKQPVDFGAIKVPVVGQGGAVNPLHPINRVNGLSEGRRWRVPLFDPMSADLGKMLPAEFREFLTAFEGVTVPVLEAQVRGAVLEWQDEDVPCFLIEYRKPAEPEPVARTWVRRRDGLVLQQQSRNDLMELTLVRQVSK